MEVPLLQMILAKGVGDIAIRRFCDAVLQRHLDLPADGFADYRILARDGLFSDALAKRIADQLSTAQNLWIRLKGQQIEMVWIGHRDYPEHIVQRLGRQAPSVLFLKGNRSLLNSPGVGFCGSRRASLRGLSIAEQCARSVASAGYSIVSGYAGGVDEHAHRAAMHSAGRTIMVLAEGILQHRERPSVCALENEVNHLYVSQFPPNCGWFAHNAMKRNDLILGLSKAMIVIEAGESGGSLAAGESSMKFGEPLYVVDYRTAPSSALGNRILLEKGARPIRSNRRGVPTLDDLFQIMRATPEPIFANRQLQFEL